MNRRPVAALLSMVALASFATTADAVVITSGNVEVDFVSAPPQIPPSLTPQDLRVGNTASGRLRVDGGSALQLNNNASADPFLVVGRRSGSDGSAIVIDNGRVDLNGSDNPGGTNVQIGREGFGRVTIHNGGSLNLINPDLGNAGVDDGAALSVGRAIGGGDLVVDNGSITIDSEASSFSIGREAATASTTVRNGSTISVLDGGPVGPDSGAVISVGRSGAANASMIVTDSTVLVRSNSAARLFVGRETATAALRVTGPTSTVAVDGPDSRLVVGRDAGSTGIAVFENGANIDISGAESDLEIARVGGSNGSVTIQSGTDVNVTGADGDVRVAADTTGIGGTSDGGTGTLIVTGAGSRLNVRDTVIAGSPVSFGGTGTPTATVIVANGGQIAADRLVVGRGATLTGSAGSVTGIVINDGGFIAPGFSPGILTVDNFVQTAGTLAIEIGGLLPGEFDVLNVLGNATFSGGSILFSSIDGFLPSAGDLIPFLTATGSINIVDTDFSFFGAEPGFDFSVNVIDGALAFLANNDAIAVTEPSAIWGLLGGLFSIGLLASARSRRIIVCRAKV